MAVGSDTWSLRLQHFLHILLHVIALPNSAARNSIGQFGLPRGVPNRADHVAGVVQIDAEAFQACLELKPVGGASRAFIDHVLRRASFCDPLRPLLTPSLQ